ncbi:hypothetical protein [Lysinibacillus piscis]|uniref:Fibronectin type-III domain-containing protein n=1 Tax=Lysinibacillus piscis TaxID=2518931 RepID=A0ABQ5NIP2_9BACI|nr:hypothetical protein [Lysinibacillus sp. KH24]GLC88242.1 hypothetical protein LYSBPC_13690 [Lysinibacillus sp. KH24]
MENTFKQENLQSLLGGKEIKHGTNPNNPLGTTKLITDGDSTTGFLLKKEIISATVSDFLIYDFETPQVIDKYKIYIENYNGQSVYLVFLDGKGAVLYSQEDRLVPGDHQIYSLPKRISDVKKVYIYNSNGSSSGSDYKVIEWDLYKDPSLDFNLVATAERNSITLNWNEVNNATSYTMKRALKSGGPHEVIATDVQGGIYIDNAVEYEKTYYYIVTAVNATTEIVNSNEASAMISKSKRAILRVTLMNEVMKEYDLSAQELEAFIDWYNARTNGTGLEEYAFEKTWNMGPFTKRTEYVIYSKILMFEVDEYFI